ncbi:MAG: DUF2339 domain-containing protein [Bacteroidetes bacterium]|nr:DUF2339 domain-containing protein [Bacteroidota bacterium]
MEIFLLVVVIALVVIFHFVYSSKFKRLHEHMNHLQRELAKVIQSAGIPVVNTETSTKTSTEEKVIIPEKEIIPPVIPLEKIIEEEEIPPVMEEEIVEEEINIPIIENPRVRQTIPAAETAQASWWEKFKERNPDLEKFIGENLLSKIAITILVIGIAFFVKYAIDQNWINEAARVGIGILCGSIVMAFAHKLRIKFKPFSSVLVAGAIAIFYFTIGIGFHEYHLFSQTVAFAIMFVITGFSVFISVAYDRLELAALAITGGFAVPFMLSTGQGNYKVLFTYILILDLGMLALAYIKKWNLINILAYGFTVILYSAWLGTRVIHESFAPYKGAFFFGLVFYVVFVLMNLVNNIKVKREFSYIELIILISNTFVFYASGMLVLNEWHPEYRGVYTIAMALFNFVLALLLYKYFKADKKLVYLLIGMTLTFATLAAPVQLKGNYITLFWGAEVALLIWLSQRSQLKAFKLASIAVSILMFVSLMIDLGSIYDYAPDGLAPLTNKGFITGLMCALFLFAGVFFLKQEEKLDLPSQGINAKVYGTVLSIAAIFILYLTGFLEIHQQSSFYINSKNSVVCISGFYHITFTSLLGIVLLKRYTTGNNIISFILLAVNFIYFAVIFSIAPAEELQERCMGLHQSYLGYVAHLAALAALVLHSVLIIKAGLKHNNFILSARALLIWIFGTLTIVILSNEAILDVMMLKLRSFVREDEIDIVSDVYRYMHTQVIKIALPILWGAIAFVLLSVGIKRQLKELRIMALVLLAITLVKLFTYDINNVSEAGKIIAFIILGVVLLIMSFMYQKIKALILSEENNTDESPAINPLTADENPTD